MAKSKRMLQENYPKLRLEPPEFDDPKVKEWAKKVEEQINNVLVRIMQQNQDRMLSALFYGTGGITTALTSGTSLTITGGTDDWEISAVGSKLLVKYNGVLIDDWRGT